MIVPNRGCRRLAGAFLLLTACSGGSATELPPGDPTHRDVLLVSIDTLRADHLGVYGATRDTSPRIDALANGGVRFESAWSVAPWTLPSHATILSGLTPPHHGAIEADRQVPGDIPWLPTAFHDAGYQTYAAVGTLFVSKVYGFDRGFDVFDDFGITDEKQNLKKTADAEQVFGRIRELWAASEPGKPVFAFAHVYDAHYPYGAPSPWDGKFDRPKEKGDPKYKNYMWSLAHPLTTEQMDHQVAQYDEEIAYVDDALGRLVDELRAGGRDVTVVIVADHGEEFGERGGWGHAHTLWPEQLHVPWIVNGSGIAPLVVSGHVGMEDVAPTLAGLASVPYPQVDGRDRAEQAKGGADPGESGQYAETSRFDANKLRWSEHGTDLVIDLAGGGLMVCDLARDPGCERDVTRDDPQKATDMLDRLLAYVGTPIEALADGRVKATDGGKLVTTHLIVGDELTVSPGARFGVVPMDARFGFDGDAAPGPWRLLGGPLPADGAPVAVRGALPGGGSVDLRDAEKQQLEALGYVEPP